MGAGVRGLRCKTAGSPCPPPAAESAHTTEPDRPRPAGLCARGTELSEPVPSWWLVRGPGVSERLDPLAALHAAAPSRWRPAPSLRGAASRLPRIRPRSPRTRHRLRGRPSTEPSTSPRQQPHLQVRRGGEPGRGLDHTGTAVWLFPSAVRARRSLREQIEHLRDDSSHSPDIAQRRVLLEVPQNDVRRI